MIEHPEHSPMTTHDMTSVRAPDRWLQEEPFKIYEIEGDGRHAYVAVGPLEALRMHLNDDACEQLDRPGARLSIMLVEAYTLVKVAKLDGTKWTAGQDCPERCVISTNVHGHATAAAAAWRWARFVGKNQRLWSNVV